MFVTAEVGWVIGRRVHVELDPAVLYKSPRAFVDMFVDDGSGKLTVERVCVADLRDIQPDGRR